MAPKRNINALGPGELIIGETKALLDISCQVTAAKITFKADAEDDMPTLCGGIISGERTYAGTLEFTAAQDFEKAGLIDWTWTHAGEEVPFTLTPRRDETAVVKGRVVVDPIDFGGDVKKRNTSDAEWALTEWAFTPDSTDDTTEYVPAPAAP